MKQYKNIISKIDKWNLIRNKIPYKIIIEWIKNSLKILKMERRSLYSI